MGARSTAGLAGNPNASSSDRTKKRGGFSFSYRIPDASKTPTKQITPIVIFNGSYSTSYFDDDGNETTSVLTHGQVLRHFSPITKRYVRCLDNMRPGYNRDGDYTLFPAGMKECNGCVEADKPKDQRKVSFASPCTVWNIIELGYFHEIDSDKINENTGKAYKDWVPCIDKEKCKLCKAGNQRSFGRKHNLTLNWNQSRQLTRYDLIDLAAICRCGGEIEAVAFKCEKCGAVYKDCTEDTPTDAQLLQLRSLPYACKQCNHDAILVEVNKCDKCDEPHALSLPEVMFRLYFPAKNKEEKNEDEEQTRNKDTTLAFSAPKLIPASIREAIAPMMKPFDLDRVQPKLQLAQQAKTLGVTNHFVRQAQRDEEETQERKGKSDAAERWADDDFS